MKFSGLLVANRGEIAIRVLRTAAEHGIRSVAIFADDDAASLHTRRADAARSLGASGVRAYLDGERILSLARETGCDAIHPGYGFLAENAAFAKRCAESGIRFVGPRAEVLERFGDKLAARALADRCGVPVLPGTAGPTSLEHARAFFAALPAGAAMMLKAVAGGGGRGTRAVRSADEIEPAFARCQSEARQAFGNGELYAERLLEHARHVEVQIAGDGSGAVVHLGERECTLQRRWQKLCEIAPSPSLSPARREELCAAALRLAAEVRYDGLGTFEFLLCPEEWAFIETNPRLQVEHTVTEAVTGLDLVALQLELASGRSLAQLGLARPPERRGIALQLRVNLETLGADGVARPASGTLGAYEPPSGPGVRVDGYGYAGYRTSPSYDSLLAKVICHAPSGSLADVIGKGYRALCEFRIEGVSTNLSLLQNLLAHPDVVADRVHTRFVEEHSAELQAPPEDHPRLWFDARPGARLAGVKVDAGDPLAVLAHGKAGAPAPVAAPVPAPEGAVAVLAPMQGTIVATLVREGDRVRADQPLFVMEAMKMEHVIPAPLSGIVAQLGVAIGDAVYEGHALAHLEPADVQLDAAHAERALDLDAIRPDLAEVQRRHALTLDAARPDAVERRRKTGQRTARENVDDLCDPGSYVEYAPLVVAAQRRRRTLQDLIERTPADGMLAGIGRVNGRLFDDARSRCVVMSYDYTVLAGTQGMHNHKKKDRLFELAERWRLPIVFFTEGGGGRPGDTDAIGGAGLDTMAFHYFGRLSGLVPLIGINSGRCFAGNAAILGCCDVVIATANSNIGMGGPAMIEGGGLGVFRPEEVGPMAVQVPNGVVDVAVADEAEAVRVARQYLSYFQGPVSQFECADQRLLRTLIPENRLRVYEVRDVIAALADTDSVLELRRHFGVGMLTALVRVEGLPLGVIANNPKHLGGAIDSEGADKAARFMQLCDAFDVPILFLCDTPGMMVGPEVEKTALVRHCSRLFVTGANLSVPFFTIVLRKGYGLGAQAMAGGSFKAGIFTVAWPTGEFGGMGLEGSVKLGFRNELAAITDPAERKRRYDEMVARAYEHGKAISTASFFEIDDVIDPADSRRWIASTLRSVPPPPPREGKKRPNVDTW